jgi:hypothetical protein
MNGTERRRAPAHVSERPRAGYPGSQRVNHQAGAKSGET